MTREEEGKIMNRKKRLYQLYPRKKWKPWYDKAHAFVVRATDEQEARELCASYSGDEDNEYKFGNASKSVWQDPEITICRKLTVYGKTGIIMRDFRAG